MSTSDTSRLFEARVRSDNTIRIPIDTVELNKLKPGLRILLKIENIVYDKNDIKENDNS